MTGLVPVGDVIHRSERTVALQPDATYREVTVRLWGKGVVERRSASGAEIAGEKRFVVRPGQFILSRIDARNGACGIVPDSLDGAVVSSDFPVFDIDASRALPAYMSWISKAEQFVALCRRASEGTTNRVRLQEQRFLAALIPLPPLEEQQRIVARIGELASKVGDASALQERAGEDLSHLLGSEANRLLAQIEGVHGSTPLGQLNPHVTSGPRDWAKQYANCGLRFYRAQDISAEGRISQDNPVYLQRPTTAQGQSAKLQPGDIMLVITGATVGRVAVFPDDATPGFVSQHVAICRLPQDRCVSRYVWWCLVAPQGQGQLLGQRYGQGKPGLNLTNVRSLRLPLPPVAEQVRVACHLDAVESRVSELRVNQRRVRSELNALLPSILDKAFKGEF